MIYLDSETPLIARGKLAQRPVCVQHATDDANARIDLWDDFDVDTALAGTLCGANLAYDMACFAAADLELILPIFDAYDNGRIVDVLLDAKLLDIAAGEYEHRSHRGWNLQELARREGVRIEKDSDDETGDGSWRLRFGSLDRIPVDLWPAGARRYALAEIPATRTVYLAQQERRKAWQAQGLDPLGYHSAHSACSAFALHLASCQGVLTDPARVEAVAERVETYLAATGQRLTRAGLVRANGTRNTQAAAKGMVDACVRAGRAVTFTDGAAKKEDDARNKLAMLAAEHATATKGIAAIERKATKLLGQWHRGVHLPGVKCDRDQAILSGSRVLEMYADYQGANLVRGRVTRMREGVHMPLQTRFDPLKETSRTSSTIPQLPLVGEQMQNFPRSSGTTPAEKKLERELKKYFTGLRECFTPPPGWRFIAADFSSAELHTVAQLCTTLFGFSKLAELLNAGIDVHWWLAAVTLGLDYETIKGMVEYELDRQRVKPGNFGFWGGMGPEKFVLYSRKGYGIRFTVDEARAFKAQWRNAFGETRPYFDWINRQLDGHATFTHVHPTTGFVRGGCFYTSGANHGFQHLCAVGAKLALYEVTRACYTKSSPLFGCRPWNFVHDDIIAIAPIDQAPEAADEMSRIMKETFNQFVRDVPTEAEPLVSSVWSKHAKTIRDANGRLECWHPPMAVAA